MAGGNPGIQASFDDLKLALSLMDEIVDEADGAMNPDKARQAG